MKLNAVNNIFQEYIESCLQYPYVQRQHLSGNGTTYFLEEKLRRYYNKKHALAFCNATTALQALCVALDLNNAEILTSPINWGGSISPFLLQRNKLCFTSIDPVSMNLSVNDLPFAITNKTKAVLSVDFNGTPVDSEVIKTFCLQNNLIYISDSAQSLGSSLNNKPAGYFADAIVLSFSPGKSFFAGEGGAVITDDDNIYEKLLWCSQHPSRQKTVFGISNYNDYAPINGRMNPLSSILLNETFESSLNALHEKQTECYKLLCKLQKMEFVELTPHISKPTSSTFFSFVLQLKPDVTLQMMNSYLTKEKQPFSAVQSSFKLIPFDKSFMNQFRGKFSCSKNLLELNKILKKKNSIRLISYESLDCICANYFNL